MTPIAAANGNTAAAFERLNKAATCQQLKVSARCLEEMVAKGRFPPGIRLGREKYWTQASIDEFLRLEFHLQAAYWRRRPL